MKGWMTIPEKNYLESWPRFEPRLGWNLPPGPLSRPVLGMLGYVGWVEHGGTFIAGFRLGSGQNFVSCCGVVPCSNGKISLDSEHVDEISGHSVQGHHSDDFLLGMFQILISIYSPMRNWIVLSVYVLQDGHGYTSTCPWVATASFLAL